MHIKEVNEHLDYGAYWTFPPGVHDITKAAGNRFWRDIEGMADSYPCSPCKPGAQALTHGGHDVINVLLGRRVQTPQHYRRLIQMVHEAEKKQPIIEYHCTGGHCHGSMRK